MPKSRFCWYGRGATYPGCLPLEPCPAGYEWSPGRESELATEVRHQLWLSWCERRIVRVAPPLSDHQFHLLFALKNCLDQIHKMIYRLLGRILHSAFSATQREIAVANFRGAILTVSASSQFLKPEIASVLPFIRAQ